MTHRVSSIIGQILFLFIFAVCSFAQDFEPRRWSHLPKDINILGLGYGYSDGDISFDPALRIENAEQDLNTFALRYVRTFELCGKNARLDLIPIFKNSRWTGLLDGEPAQAKRSGFADPIVRFAINLMGPPPLDKKEYQEYHQNTYSHTIIGAGLAVHLPLGEYKEDKLLNLGSNRFILRPQLGVVRNWGAWSVELTGATWFFTENDEFFQETKREQDPLYVLQSQVVYNFTPRHWSALSIGYSLGGESKIDGERKDDDHEVLGWAFNVGFPLNKRFSYNIGYIGSKTQNSTGTDSHSIMNSIAFNW